MSGKGNCYDNAMVETFFKTLKSELVWRTIFCTRQEAGQAIGRYIDGFYNPVRAPFRSRLHEPGAVRKNGRQMTQCLSTKTGQVHSVEHLRLDQQRRLDLPLGCRSHSERFRSAAFWLLDFSLGGLGD